MESISNIRCYIYFVYFVVFWGNTGEAEIFENCLISMKCRNRYCGRSLLLVVLVAGTVQKSARP